MKLPSSFSKVWNIIATGAARTQRSWFNLKVNDNIAELVIDDEIGGWGISARHLVDQIKAIPENTRIKVSIFSPGGDVLEGNQIRNALVAHPGGVDVEIGALCASIATVIACSGSKVTMARNGLYMVHQPWTVCVGGSEDFRRMATILDKMQSTIVDAYVSKTARPAADLSKLMDDETWLTAEEALENKFIDEIIEPDPRGDTVQDRFDLSKFKNSVSAISRMPKTTSGAANATEPPAGNGGQAQPPKASEKAKPKTKNQSPTITADYKAGKVRVFAS